jgi:hypothetical protein
VSRPILADILSVARAMAITWLGGTTLDREHAAVAFAERMVDTCSTMAGAIDDALAMVYDARGRCRSCCRSRDCGHADVCEIAPVIAPLIGTARALADRQHERAVETARGGRAEMRA